MGKTIDKSNLPFHVDTDKEGNVVLFSKEGTDNIGSCKVEDKEKAMIVRLVGFEPKVLKEFSEIEIDESLFDITNFARAVSDTIKGQRVKKLRR